MLDLVPSIVYRVPQPDYRAEFISPEVERLIGFTREEWVADPEIWVRQLHAENHDRVLAEMDAGSAPFRSRKDFHRERET